MNIQRGRVFREKRRDEANERAARKAQRSPDEQLRVLNARLGKGKGAKRERARLARLLEAGK